MSDLLKEAIADAKAVRETALENAKAALEEAFTPQLKSMLSAKLREDEHEEDEFEDEEIPSDEVPVDDVPAVDAEVPVDDELPIDDLDGDGVPDELEGEEEVEEGPLGAAAGAGGAHYLMNTGDPFTDALIAAAGGAVGDALTDGTEPTEEVQESNLDLDSVIAELEEELDEESVEEVEEAHHEDEEAEETYEDADIEEEYEIDEAALSNQEEDLTAEDIEKLYNIANHSMNELAEYKQAVHFLKDKLHEVNILNAKLLYTNKLFKEYSLDNNQKLKVVENFDRAQTTREIKLVFSTIAEQLNENTGIPKRKSIKESASAAVSSTKPSKESTKVITEEGQVADRFRKLAGLIKG